MRRWLGRGGSGDREGDGYVLRQAWEGRVPRLLPANSRVWRAWFRYFVRVGGAVFVALVLTVSGIVNGPGVVLVWVVVVAVALSMYPVRAYLLDWTVFRGDSDQDRKSRLVAASVRHHWRQDCRVVGLAERTQFTGSDGKVRDRYRYPRILGYSIQPQGPVFKVRTIAGSSQTPADIERGLPSLAAQTGHEWEVVRKGPQTIEIQVCVHTPFSDGEVR